MSRLISYFSLLSDPDQTYPSLLPESPATVPTCMPDVLDPHVGASREEQPVYWDEEEANHVAGQSDTDEKY